MSQERVRQRTHYSAEQKVSILREHLIDGRPVSEICDEYGLHPTVFYRWQRELFEGGHMVFERRRSDPVVRKGKQEIA